MTNPDSRWRIKLEKVADIVKEAILQREEELEKNNIHILFKDMDVAALFDLKN